MSVKIFNLILNEILYVKGHIISIFCFVLILRHSWTIYLREFHTGFICDEKTN